MAKPMIRQSNAARLGYRLWPGVLMCLPLALLAALAAVALRQDRAAAEREAEGRGRELATAAATHLEQVLQQAIPGSDPGRFTFRTNLPIFTVNSEGVLMDPSPLVWPPQPHPLDPARKLSKAKLDQWVAGDAAFKAGQWQRAAESYLAFLDGRTTRGSQLLVDQESGILDNGFRPLALFRRGLALERLGQTNAAIAAINDVFDGFVLGRGARTESGLPWAHLAALKILNLAGDRVAMLPEAWRQSPLTLAMVLRQDDSPFAPEIQRRLEALAAELATTSQFHTRAEHIIETWERANQARQFHAEAARSRQGEAGAWPKAFWVQGTNGWLAVAQRRPGTASQPENRQTLYGVFAKAWLESEIAGVCRREDRQNHFAVQVELCGGRLDVSEAKLVNRPRVGVPPTGISGGAGSGANGLNAGVRQGDPQPAADRPRLFSAQSLAAGFPVSVTASLKDPTSYFGSQHRRQWIFSGLLVAAVAVGLVAAWATQRTMMRQQRLAELKTNFVSSVSHELRAPIASMRLMAESLERGRVTESARQKEYFHLMTQECRRLSSLIENVLDFARIEQGRKQYEFEPADLAEMLRQTVKVMEPAAQERQITLAVTLPNSPAGTAQASVDARAIQQALVNLIDNALKHSPAGSAVTVGLENAGGGKESPGVRLFVEDHGEGIPAGEHEKIFERFYRRGSELRRETRGVGIGLSIVKHIVEAHRGRVVVRSQPGQGSRFTIELPPDPETKSRGQA